MPRTKQGQKIRLTLALKKEPKLKYSSILNKSAKHGRSAVKIQDKKDTLLIEITASDSTALRASINAILRDLQVIEATKP